MSDLVIRLLGNAQVFVHLDEGVAKIATSISNASARLAQQVQQHGDDAEVCESMEALAKEHMDLLLQPLQYVDNSGSSGHAHEHSHFGQAESLLRLLLNAERLQHPLFEAALKQLLDDANYIAQLGLAGVATQQATASQCEGNSQLGMRRDRAHGRDTADALLARGKRLLDHVRWCDCVFDSRRLLETIFDVMQSLPPERRCDLIVALPGLASDKPEDQTLVVKTLLEMLDEGPDVTPSILEALANMSLPGGGEDCLLRQVLAAAVGLLDSASDRVLPAVTRFLLDSVDEELAPKYVSMICEKLDAYLRDCSAQAPQKASSAIANNANGAGADRAIREERTRQQSRDRERQTCVAVLLSILRASFSARPVLLGALQKSADGLGITAVWVLFCLAGSQRHMPKVLTTLLKRMGDSATVANAPATNSNTVANVHPTLKAIAGAVRGYGRPLEAHFPSMLELAQACLSNARIGPQSATLREVGVCLYRTLYLEFISGGCRQDIVGRLVAHVGVAKGEGEVALGLLAALGEEEWLARQHGGDVSSGAGEQDPAQSRHFQSQSQAVPLAQFAPFVKTLLDEVQSLSDAQQRRLFRLVFQVCMTPSASSSSSSSSSSSAALRRDRHAPCMLPPPDDVLILLRKLSASPSSQRKRVALIGHVALLSLTAGTGHGHGHGRRGPETSLAEKVEDLMRKSKDDSTGQNFLFLLAELSAAVRDRLLDDPELLEGVQEHLAGAIAGMLGRGEAAAVRGEIVALKERSRAECVFFYGSWAGWGKPAPVLSSSLAAAEEGEALWIRVLPSVLLSEGVVESLPGPVPSLPHCRELVPSVLLQMACHRREKVLQSGGAPEEDDENERYFAELLRASLVLPSDQFVTNLEAHNVPLQTTVCVSLRLAVEWNLAMVNAFAHLCVAQGEVPSSRGRVGRAADQGLDTPLRAYLHKVNDFFESMGVCVETLQRCPDFCKSHLGLQAEETPAADSDEDAPAKKKSKKGGSKAKVALSVERIEAKLLEGSAAVQGSGLGVCALASCAIGADARNRGTKGDDDDRVRLTGASLNWLLAAIPRNVGALPPGPAGHPGSDTPSVTTLPSFVASLVASGTVGEMADYLRVYSESLDGLAVVWAGGRRGKLRGEAASDHGGGRGGDSDEKEDEVSRFAGKGGVVVAAIASLFRSALVAEVGVWLAQGSGGTADDEDDDDNDDDGRGGGVGEKERIAAPDTLPVLLVACRALCSASDDVPASPPDCATTAAACLSPLLDALHASLDSLVVAADGEERHGENATNFARLQFPLVVETVGCVHAALSAIKGWSALVKAEDGAEHEEVEADTDDFDDGREEDDDEERDKDAGGVAPRQGGVLASLYSRQASQLSGLCRKALNVQWAVPESELEQRDAVAVKARPRTREAVDVLMGHILHAKEPLHACRAACERVAHLAGLAKGKGKDKDRGSGSRDVPLRMLDQDMVVSAYTPLQSLLTESFLSACQPFTRGILSFYYNPNASPLPPLPPTPLTHP